MRRSFRRAERAQSLVELAISLTVMLLLLSGAVTFGMAFFSYVAMRDAAQEGALYASFNPCVDTSNDAICQRTEGVDVAGVRTRVRASSTTPVDFSNATVVPDAFISAVSVTAGYRPDGTADNTYWNACEGSTKVAGVPTPNGIRVTVEYDYPIFMPFVGAIIGGQTIHLRAEVTDTILQPRCPASP